MRHARRCPWWLLGLLLAALHTRAAGLSAGAGKAPIAIGAADLPVDGFVGVHDLLYARVILLGNDVRRIALVTIDLTSLSQDLIARVQATVQQATQAKAADVVVSASHTFSTPHVQGPGATAAEQARKSRLVQAIEQAVAQASAQAAHSLQPATLGFASGVSDVNVNRDVPTANGWWLGANEDGPSDKAVGVVRLDGPDHQPIALVVNYAVQSSVMEASAVPTGGPQISADLAGAAMGHVERQYGNKPVALWLVGAAADQAPRMTALGGHQNGAPLLRLLGERLGGEVVRVAEGIHTAAATSETLSVTQGSVTVTAQASSPQASPKKPSRDYRFQASGPVAVPYWIVRLGDIGVVGVQAELSSQTGVQIKQRSALRGTLVATMVNGAAKYMPDASAYERITYEAMSSPYAKGSVHTLVEAIVRDVALH